MEAVIGYVTLAFAVFGLAAYCLRPSARMMPWYKFAAAFVLMSAIGFYLVVYGKSDTNSAFVHEVPQLDKRSSYKSEAAANATQEDVIGSLAHIWIDSYRKRIDSSDRWYDLISPHLQYDNMPRENYNIAMAYAETYKSECNRLIEEGSDLIAMINNNEIKVSILESYKISVDHCAGVAGFLAVSTVMSGPDQKAAKGKVWEKMSATLKASGGDAVIDKNVENKAIELFSHALNLAGMNADLERY